MAIAQQPVLFEAIAKLARAGEQAGFSVEELIELLKTGVSVETLLDLICCRLEIVPPCIGSFHLTLGLRAHSSAGD